MSSAENKAPQWDSRGLRCWNWCCYSGFDWIHLYIRLWRSGKATRQTLPQPLFEWEAISGTCSADNHNKRSSKDGWTSTKKPGHVGKWKTCCTNPFCCCKIPASIAYHHKSFPISPPLCSPHSSVGSSPSLLPYLAPLLLILLSVSTSPPIPLPLSPPSSYFLTRSSPVSLTSSSVLSLSPHLPPPPPPPPHLSIDKWSQSHACSLVG